jgi:enterochelin esterase-like enzyme
MQLVDRDATTQQFAVFPPGPAPAEPGRRSGRPGPRLRRRLLGLAVLLTLGWLAEAAGLLALQSVGFLLLLVAASVLAVATAAIRWGRPPTGWGCVFGRIGTVLGCQLLAVLVVAVGVNNWFDFYSSWTDLLGLGNTSVVIRNAALPGTAAVPTGATAAVDRQFGPPDPGVGRLVSVTVPGARTRLSDHVDVYLPPQYGEPGFAHSRFPVALVLAGYPGSNYGLERWVTFPSTMDTMLHAGRVAPMVLVFSPSALLPPWDTECTDVPGGPQVQTFFAQDLPQWIGAHYRVDRPGSWAVVGVSTGGFCAAKLTLSHPEVFRAGVSMSGTLVAETDPTTGDLFGGSLTVRHDNDPLWRITHLPVPAVSLLLTSTRQERGVYPQLKLFLHKARPPLKVSSIELPFGGHNAGVWRTELPQCLQWMSARLPAVSPVHVGGSR